MKLLRVFTRRTRFTPTDELAFVGDPPLFRPPDGEVHISCTFTADKPIAYKLADKWGKYYRSVAIGGPAFDDPGDNFVPGRYLSEGSIITSRGCPNRCWFCFVPKREGGLRELPITDGWIVHDNNLFACSDEHIKEVFAMLERQTNSVKLVGGLEAKRLRGWHINGLLKVKPKRIYFAYDTPDDYEPLVLAGKRLHDAGFSRECLWSYVLIGYRGDTMAKAFKRLIQTWEAGFFPFAMLYQDEENHQQDKGWKSFRREWCNPSIIRAKFKPVK